MKLTLKHVKGYLDTGLKFQSQMDKPFDEFGKRQIWTLDGVNKLFGDYCLLTKENNDAYAIQTCRLLLKPLSDLTRKELELEGFDSHIDYLTYENKGSEWTLKAPFNMVQYLLSKHFDIYNLIENGLAIDINTIEL